MIKRLSSTAILAAMLMAGAAQADQHGDKDEAPMKSGDTMESARTENSDIRTENTLFVFLAIDENDDGRISKGEWASWQGRGMNRTVRLEDHDLDSDGDMEFSEYLMAVRAG